MSWEKFTNFMNGLAAANLLMNRAGHNGCFIEYVCLATSVIDAQLRMGLILEYQLDSRSNEIPTDLVLQADDDKIISERNIYARALGKSIITQNEFNHIEDLYKRRNKVVHRYIISEITTDEVLQIANEYQEMIDEINNIIFKLEEKQIECGVGITVSDETIPASLRDKTKEIVWEMAKEKHGHPILAKNLLNPNKRYISIKNKRNDPCPCGSGKKYKKCCLYIK